MSMVGKRPYNTIQCSHLIHATNGVFDRSHCIAEEDLPVYHFPQLHPRILSDDDFPTAFGSPP